MDYTNTISESDLFQLLSKKLGQKEAKTLIKYVNAKAKESEGAMATKEDLSNAKLEITEKVHSAKNSILVTVVLLIIGQLGVLLGIIQIFLK